ncbi:hypothetical protein AVEN_271453-1 [Araneus ventricosus]|uniref:Uncharacterized protein n=1 Tax=Araneus ventricosus TaxID=182803 RepID=A0A4Y2P3T6_ARAVE|nr:hypothetical protein AVEN_271453-1 [Araneus ventricosus]
MRGIWRPSTLRKFLSSYVIFSFYETKCRKYSTLVENLPLNKLSIIIITKLISFLSENENLIKQQPDATDSDPEISPSPRLQTDGARPSRGSIPRTLISLLTSFQRQ